MNQGDRSKRVEELFRLGVLVPRAERDGFLRRHAGEDQELARELAQLLAQDDEGTKDFLASPVLSSWSKGSDTSRASDDPSVAREVTVGSRIDRIGRYQIERALGEGGMGAVYLAEQLEPVRRKVALKIVKLGMDTRRVVARFERERQALALMDHPGIARIYDGGATESGRPYFVMEYVPGAPFTDYCDRAKLDVRSRLELFVRVCEAVQHAHQRGIVHRDLKPSNVLVAERDGQPVAKVIDFGVARATAECDEGERTTRASEVIGTYAYMSPEQADPEGAGVGPSSDVYSLGVLLYETLTGALPVDAEELRGKSPSEVSRLLADTDPPAPSTKLTRLGAASVPCARRRGGLDPRSLARRLSGDLDWITLKAMERDPERRYRTAAELAGDVRRHLAHRAVLAGPPGAAYRVRKYVRRHKLGVGAAAALVLTLASGAAGTALGFREARSGARVALDSEAVARAALAEESAERQRVEQAGEMVLRLLDLANPESTWRGDDSAVALLLKLSGEIGEAFIDDPEGEARLRLNVGRALRTRGEFDRALAELLRVQDLEHGHGYEADIAVRAETSRELHRLAVDSGGHADYTAGLAAAAATAQALSAEAPEAGAAAALLLKHAESRGFQLLEDDLDSLEKSLPPQGGARARLLAADVTGIAGGYLGLHYAFKEAEPLLAYSLELRTAVEGPLHPEVVRGLGELVEHMLQQGRSGEAARLVDARLALFHRALPRAHWLTAELESRLGECLSLEGREPEARDLLVAAREALVRERGQRSRPALEAGLRLRDHYTRAGALDLVRELDLSLGDAREGPRARDREAAWGRTALALGADQETADALVALLSSTQGSPAAGDGPSRDAATALAGLAGTDRGVADLVVRALESVQPRVAGTPLAGVLSDALLAARAASERLDPEALLVEQGEPRVEQPTLSDPERAPENADTLARAGFAAAEAPPPPAAPVETPPVADAEPLAEDAPQPAVGTDEWVLFAWSIACSDHGDAMLYWLAAEAALSAVALEPHALDYLPVLALSLARVDSGEAALACLKTLADEEGSVGTIGMAVCALVELDARKPASASAALEAAEAAFEADPESAPSGMQGLLVELRERLRELQPNQGSVGENTGPAEDLSENTGPSQDLFGSTGPAEILRNPKGPNGSQRM